MLTGGGQLIKTLTMLCMYAVSITPHRTLTKFDYIQNDLFHGWFYNNVAETITSSEKIKEHRQEHKLSQTALIINNIFTFYELRQKLKLLYVIDQNWKERQKQLNGLEVEGVCVHMCCIDYLIDKRSNQNRKFRK